MGIFRALGFGIVACLLGFGAVFADENNVPQQKPRLDLKPEIGITSQVFLRNYIQFTDDRMTGGASSSLISFDGEVYVLTAKHLLGSAMGIKPEVQPTKLDEELELWLTIDNPSLYAADDREPDFMVPVTGIYQPNDDWGEDLIVLKTGISSVGATSGLLPLAADPPELGETIYVIGCPYSQGGDCAQIIYSGALSANMDGFYTFSWDDAPDDLSGFSGAALLNAKGEIIGVIYGGSPRMGLATPIPAWLRAKAG